MLFRHFLPVSALLLMLGAFGPWAHGTYVERPALGEERAEERAVHGREAGGILVAVPALAIAVLAWTVPSRTAARGVILLLHFFCALVLLRALANDGLTVSFWSFRLFSHWSDVSLGWGLKLAWVAWGGVFLGYLAWIFEREDDEPAPDEAKSS